MTENQQSIINSLTAEFNRINSLTKSSSSFNLIDVTPLAAENRAKTSWDMMSEGDLKAWESFANERAYDIAEMLRKDLPNAIIQKYGDGNTFCDLPKILIKHPRNISEHPSEVVSIEV